MKILYTFIIVALIVSCFNESIAPVEEKYRTISIQQGMVKYDIEDTTLKYLSIKNKLNQNIEEIYLDVSTEETIIYIYSYEESGRLFSFRKYLNGYSETDFYNEKIDAVTREIGEIKYNVYCKSCHGSPSNLSQQIFDVFFLDRTTLVNLAGDANHKKLTFLKEVDIKAIHEFIDSPVMDDVKN